VHLLESGTLQTHTIILATGAYSSWLGVEGENDYRGGGVSSCATCDGFLYKDQHTVVIGGGDTAMEDALVRDFGYICGGEVAVGMRFRQDLRGTLQRPLQNCRTVRCAERIPAGLPVVYPPTILAKARVSKLSRLARLWWIMPQNVLSGTRPDIVKGDGDPPQGDVPGLARARPPRARKR
jgi:hypothetical protein